MVKNLILNIINRFIENEIELNGNGLYSFKTNLDRKSSKIDKTKIKCSEIVEEVLKELDYIKKDEKLNKKHIDVLYKIIVDMENLSNESIILLISSLKTYTEQTDDIDKLNNTLISNFHTNDIDFFQGILFNLLQIKKNTTTNDTISHFINNINNFKSMLCFLTDTPFKIETLVGIYNNQLIDTINTLKPYKIKHKMNSLRLIALHKDECYDNFYSKIRQTPVTHKQSTDVHLKEGWEIVEIDKPHKTSGYGEQFVNLFYNGLKKLAGKSKELESVYFKNNAMCQRRWENDSIINIDEDINEGEDVFNLYDPDVTTETDPNSKIYKNNEILKKIWFYRSDIFSIQPDKSPMYNFIDRRAEYGFKSLNVENKNIFKPSVFKKEDLHYIIPVLWFYKIYDEYKSIVINDDLDTNIDILFQYFKPEELLIYFKRYVLIEKNQFDIETLCFIIIIGALSKLTSLLVDKNIIRKNYTNFVPKDFNLFGRLTNDNQIDYIKLLINEHHTNPKGYLTFLKHIIPYYINHELLKTKLDYEYRNRHEPIKQYNVRNSLNFMLINGSHNFSSFVNYVDTKNYNYTELLLLQREYIGKTLQQIDETIHKQIPEQLLIETVETAKSTDLIPEGLKSDVSGDGINAILFNKEIQTDITVLFKVKYTVPFEHRFDNKTDTIGIQGNHFVTLLNWQREGLIDRFFISQSFKMLGLNPRIAISDIIPEMNEIFKNFSSGEVIEHDVFISRLIILLETNKIVINNRLVKVSQ